MPSIAVKSVFLAGFSIPAMIALFAGFACDQFRHKLRDAGIVFLSASAMTIFVVLTLVCLQTTEEFKKLASPESLDFFSDYWFGTAFLLAIVLIGLAALHKGYMSRNGPRENGHPR
ncbi:MAG: hypothetical protein QM715_16440 [Nibricoccus sp.]